MKNLLFALSLSNLVLMSTWINLFIPILSVADAPHFSFGALVGILAVWSFITLFTYVLFLNAARQSDERAKCLVHVLISGLLIFPWVAIRSKTLLYPISPKIQFALGFAYVAVFFFLYLKNAAGLRRMYEKFYILLFPLSLLSFGNLFYVTLLEVHQILHAHPPPVIQVEKKPALRVVWLIFDEWDLRMSFLKRPESVSLPAFDSLIDQSIFVPNSFPPANRTAVSTTSLILQKLVRVASPPMELERRFYFQGEEKEIDLLESENIFKKVRARGIKTAVSGAWMQYCSQFENALDECYRFSYHAFDYDENPFLVIGQVFSHLFVRDAETELQIARLRNTNRFGKNLLNNPIYGLVYIHFPVPHPPWIYDRNLGIITNSKKQEPSGYLDNLALADKTLAENLEIIDNLPNTALIVSADHSWRMSTNYDGEHDLRVPFLLRLPERKKKEVNVRFETIRTGEIVEKLLSGEIRNSEDAIAFITLEK